MQVFDDIKKYIDTVCGQIRWKRARSVVAMEIECHLLDQRDAYIKDGCEDDDATKKAILQMGDAVLIGQELDKAHKPKAQLSMIMLVGIFMSIGMLLNYMADKSENSLGLFSFLPYFIAFCIFVICYFIDFSLFGKYNLQLYFLILIISLTSIFIYNTIQANDWNRQLMVGNYMLSLSFLSLIYPFIFALLVYAMRNKGYLGIILSGIGFLPLAFSLLKISIGGLIIYTLSSMLILLIAICKGLFGVNKKNALLLFLIPVVLMSVFVGLIILHNSYRIDDRILALLNPDEYKNGAGYTYYLIRSFLSNAAFVGKSYGPLIHTHILKFPYAKTDASLVYLIHRFGLISLIGVLIFIVLFIVIGIYKGFKEKSALGSLIALSISFTFLFQSVLYILYNLGYGFISPLSLPFISYGKSALFINSALVGFMLSIFRSGDIYRDKEIHQIDI